MTAARTVTIASAIEWSHWKIFRISSKVFLNNISAISAIPIFIWFWCLLFACCLSVVVHIFVYYNLLELKWNRYYIIIEFFKNAF